jgi:hypothetical protein
LLITTEKKLHYRGHWRKFFLDKMALGVLAEDILVFQVAMNVCQVSVRQPK